MKILEANLVVVFWSIVFGEVLGYIGSSLELLPYNAMKLGIVATVVGLIIANGAYLLGISGTRKK